jgi:hypothetical protein
LPDKTNHSIFKPVWFRLVRVRFLIVISLHFMQKPFQTVAT